MRQRSTPCIITTTTATTAAILFLLLVKGSSGRSCHCFQACEWQHALLLLEKLEKQSLEKNIVRLERLVGIYIGIMVKKSGNYYLGSGV